MFCGDAAGGNTVYIDWLISVILVCFSGIRWVKSSCGSFCHRLGGRRVVRGVSAVSNSVINLSLSCSHEYLGLQCCGCELTATISDWQRPHPRRLTLGWQMATSEHVPSKQRKRCALVCVHWCISLMEISYKGYVFFELVPFPKVHQCSPSEKTSEIREQLYAVCNVTVLVWMCCCETVSPRQV